MQKLAVASNLNRYAYYTLNSLESSKQISATRLHFDMMITLLECTQTPLSDNKVEL